MSADTLFDIIYTMNIQNLVTEAIGDIPDGPQLSPREILETKTTLSPLALAEKIKQGVETIQADPSSSWDVCAEIIAWTTHSGNRFTSYRSSLSMLSRSTHSLQILFLSKEATEDPSAREQLCQELQNIAEALREEERGSRQRSVVGSFQSSLTYIQEVFPDEYLDVLVDISGAKQATVKRWLRGGSAQWRNGERVQRVAKTLYKFQEEKGWSRSQTIEWFQRPLACGSSPRDLWGKGGYSIPQELSAELQKHAILP